jgi:hydroxymethylpyrimidine pyrophosphatase-like HAD family hydrolase
MEEKKQTPSDSPPTKPLYRQMVVCDWDGTLYSEGAIDPKDVQTLKRLKGFSTLRVVATGRTLFSARKTIPADFPIDYLIFSCGAGIVEWVTGRVVQSHHLESKEVQEVLTGLKAGSFDYMVHGAIPDNHEFVFYSSGRPNPDFSKRCELYAEHCHDGKTGSLPEKISQFLVIEPPEAGSGSYQKLKDQLKSVSVIRTTSPLDKRSLWIEIYSPKVSKSKAAQWLANEMGISSERTLAVGDDYNDLDLLAWAELAFVAPCAPGELKALYPSRGGGTLSALTEAVHGALEIWNREMSFESFGKTPSA